MQAAPRHPRKAGSLSPPPRFSLAQSIALPQGRVKMSAAGKSCNHFPRRGVCAMAPAPDSIPIPRKSMFPKPVAQLAPNTYAYKSQPMVKPTGFREYDARWLLGTRNQPDGRAVARHGHRHAGARDGREARHRHRARFPRLFGIGKDGADFRHDGGRHAGARYRARLVADGLLRAIRSRRAVRGDGHRLA